TLVGPSGAGKSTLFRMILGSEHPTRGRVLIHGEPRTQPDSRCGIVYQRYSLFPHLRVWENVVFGIDLQEFSLSTRWITRWRYRKRRRQYREQAQLALARVGLAEHADKY